jgi:hypothetical protein
MESKRWGKEEVAMCTIIMRVRIIVILIAVLLIRTIIIVTARMIRSVLRNARLALRDAGIRLVRIADAVHFGGIVVIVSVTSRCSAYDGLADCAAHVRNVIAV